MTASFPSRSRRTRLVAAGLVTIVLLAAAACGKDSGSPPKVAAADITDYVALGDSYTAVAGAGPYTDDSCFRSEGNYPNLLDQKLTITHFADVSCGGATSANLTQTEYPPDGGSNPPQLRAVTKDARLVTLGLGLNDNGLSFSLLQACLEIGGKLRATCRTYLKQPDATFTSLVARMGTAVTGNLTAIRAAAPQARIVLVGYPRLISDSSPCPTQVPLTGPALTRLRSLGRDVNDTLKQVAAKNGADFVDMYAASAGHEVCSTDPWVNGQSTVTGLALPFHPYAAYHVAVADKLVALLKKK